MTWSLVAACLGLTIGGVPGALMATIGTFVVRKALRRRRFSSGTPRRFLLTLMVVQLRGGASVLGALQGASALIPEDEQLRRLVRLASVIGLSATVIEAPPEYSSLLAHLARAQRSGAALVGTVRRIIEQDLENERARRLVKVRSLPMRLMVPVTLLMLPGLVLMLYAPSLLALLDDLSGAFG